MATVDDIKVKVNVDNSQALSALRQVTAEAQRMSEALKRTSTGMGGVSAGGVSGGGVSSITGGFASALAGAAIGSSVVSPRTNININSTEIARSLANDMEALRQANAEKGKELANKALVGADKYFSKLRIIEGNNPSQFIDTSVKNPLETSQRIDRSIHNVPGANSSRMAGPYSRGGFVNMGAIADKLNPALAYSELMASPLAGGAKIVGTAIAGYKLGGKIYDAAQFVNENYLTSASDKFRNIEASTAGMSGGDRLAELIKQRNEIAQKVGGSRSGVMGTVGNLLFEGNSTSGLEAQQRGLEKLIVASQKYNDTIKERTKVQEEIDKQNNVDIYYSRQKLEYLQKEEAKRKAIVEERNAAFINSGDEESRVRRQGEYDVIKLRERLAVESDETNRGYIKDLIDFRVDETEKGLKRIVDAEQMAAIDAKIAWDEALLAQSNKDQAVKNRAKQDLFSYRNSIQNSGMDNAVFPDEALALLRQSANQHHYISMYDSTDTGR